MSKFIITPWRTQKDLLDVRHQLYNTDANTNSKRHAVDRIMAWKLRGNLPHAVESTALLVDAILHHNAQTNSTFADQAVYSAAFCRFVTGFCDIGRHKERTLEPSSMAEIARQIDMPAEFVALRHEATHEELPSIQRLVVATRQALDWLWKVYWSRLQETEDLAVLSEALASLRSEVTAQLKAFRRTRREALRTLSYNKPEWNEETNQICSHLAQVCDHNPRRAEVVAEVLVDERMIFPSNRELGSSLEGAQLLWDDFLRELANRIPGFLRIFATALMNNLIIPGAIVPEKDVEKEALADWLVHICDLEPDASESLRRDIVKRCCLHPGHWTQIVGREVLKYQPDLAVEWEDLLEASSIQPVDGAAHTRESSKPSAEAEEGPTVTRDDIIGQDAETVRASGGWIRAIAPISAPLGVVY